VSYFLEQFQFSAGIRIFPLAIVLGVTGRDVARDSSSAARSE
jgi:hypothetical protein